MRNNHVGGIAYRMEQYRKAEALAEDAREATKARVSPAKQLTEDVKPLKEEKYREQKHSELGDLMAHLEKAKRLVDYISAVDSRGTSKHDIHDQIQTMTDGVDSALSGIKRAMEISQKMTFNKDAEGYFDKGKYDHENVEEVEEAYDFSYGEGDEDAMEDDKHDKKSESIYYDLAEVENNFAKLVRKIKGLIDDREYEAAEDIMEPIAHRIGKYLY